MNASCLVLTRTDREKVYLRRYVPYSHDVAPCPGMGSAYPYHQNRVYVGVRRSEFDGDRRRPAATVDYLDHPRWPSACVCGRHFTEDDRWQVLTESLYVDPTGEEYTLREAPVGALWDATWMGRKGPDGRTAVVRLPGGTWVVDYGEGQRTGEWPRISYDGPDSPVALRDGRLATAA